MPPKLTEFAKKYGPHIAAIMVLYLKEHREAAKPLSPHLVDSVEFLTEFIFRGGKQIRPLLVLLGCLAAGGEITPGVLQVAAGVELFHKHILNLDDMADRDEERNGGPTLWKAYQARFTDWPDGDHHARTLSEIDGTLLGSFAFDMVGQAKVPAETLLKVMEIMHQHMYFETVGGWEIHYFQNHESLAESKEDEFVKGLDLVTARYTFVGPLQIGCILAGMGPESDIWKALTEYGVQVGTAFQMQDDILGLFGDSKETGKPVGNDVREGKKTLLLQRAYKAGSVEEKAFLSDVCGRVLKSGELEKVQEIVKKTGALGVAQELAKESVKKGEKALQSANLNTNTNEIFLELAEFVVERKK